MEWHTERGKTKFLVQSKLFKAEKVFADVFREIASNELLVIVRTRTFGSSS
jgi:hypothetical protein